VLVLFKLKVLGQLWTAGLPLAVVGRGGFDGDGCEMAFTEKLLDSDCWGLEGKEALSRTAAADAARLRAPSGIGEEHCMGLLLQPYCSAALPSSIAISAAIRASMSSMLSSSDICSLPSCCWWLPSMLNEQLILMSDIILRTVCCQMLRNFKGERGFARKSTAPSWMPW